MKHLLTHLVVKLTRATTLVIMLVTMPAGLVLAESSRIVVLSGQDLKPYQEVLTGLQQSLVKQGITLSVEVHVVQGNQVKTQNVIEDIKRHGAKLVVTLGNLATQWPCERSATSQSSPP